MKIFRSALLRCLPPACLVLLLAFSGCEGTTDEDNSGADSYFKNHPYQSETRETPLTTIMAISPAQATASLIGQKIIFTVSGGYGAYHWSVADEIVGKITSQGANQAMYTCQQVGNNDVTVQDEEGHFANAHISPVADTMVINPASVSLSGGALNVSFTVSGGTAPYSWTSGNPGLGTVSYSASSSYIAAYSAVAGAYGQNAVTVVDSEGRTASATITQSP